jgi:uncharacterized repeat protein (TIGR01451 family)
LEAATQACRHRVRRALIAFLLAAFVPLAYGQPLPDLVVTVSDSPDPVVAGQQVEYTITLSNQAPSSTASSISVVGSASPSLSYVPQSNAGWQCSGTGPVICQLLAPAVLSGGLSAPLLRLRYTAPGTPQTVQLSVTASALQQDLNPANNTNIVEQTQVISNIADLNLVVTPSVSSVVAGNPVSFTLVASNAGPGNAAGLTVSGSYSGPFQFGSFGVSPSWSCSPSTNSFFCSYIGGSPSGTLPQGVTAAAIVINGTAGPGAGTIALNASAVSQLNDPTPANASASINVINPTADVSIQKTVLGAQPIPRGTPFTYRLQVGNSGQSNSAASGIQVNDPLPAGLTLQSFSGNGWSCTGTVQCSYSTSLAPGQAAPPLDLVVAYTQPVPASGVSIVNTATVSASQVDPVSANNSSSVSAAIRGSANVGVALVGPSSVPTGASFSIALDVNNAGPDEAGNVTASATIATGFLVTAVSGGAGWSCLASGQSVSCSRAALPVGSSTAAQLTVTAPATAGGPFANSALVSTTSADPLPSNNSASLAVTVTQPATASLQLSKTDSVDPATVGVDFDYVLTVANPGPVDQSGVVIVDPLPAVLQYVGFSGAGWNCVLNPNNVLNCQLAGRLAPGAQSTVRVTVRAQQAGTVVNEAQVTSAQISVPVLASQATLVQPPAQVPTADIALDKSDSVDPVIVGEAFDYRLRVQNLGPDAATQVRVVDDLPPGLEFISASGAGWACSFSSALECNLAAPLPAGQSAEVVVRVRGTVVGTVSNTARANARENDPNQANNGDIERTTIVAAPLQADLQLEASAPASALPGSTVDIVANVRNNGPAVASNVVLRASIAGPWSLQSGSGGGFVCTLVGAVLECRRDTLAVGAVETLTLRGQVQANASGGALTAELAVSSAVNDPNLRNNAQNLSIAIATPPRAAADVSITKTDSIDPVAFGQRFDYILTVRNQGPAAAADVVIRDTLPAGLRFVAVTGAGLSCTGGATVECRAAAPLAPGAELVATVTVDAPSVSGTLVNEASVSTSTDDPNLANNRAQQSTSVARPQGSEAAALLEGVLSGDALAADAVAPVVSLCDGASGRVSAFCDALYGDAANGNGAAVSDALRAVYPEEVLSHYASVNQLATTQFFNVDARLSELRGGGGGFSLSGLTLIEGSQSIPVGLLAGLFQRDEDVAVGGSGDLVSPWGFFVNGVISRGDQRIRPGDREVVVDFDTIGITAGADYRRSARWVIGGAIGYNRFRSDLTDFGSLENRGYTLAAYNAYYLNDQVYWDTRLSYARLRLDQARRIRIGLTGFSLDETLNADTDARQFAVASSMGYHYSRGGWSLTPNGFVRYVRTDIDGFAESGSEFAVRYGDQQVTSLVYGVGLQVNRVFSLSKGVLVPQFDLIWNRETRNDDTVIDARFVSADAGELFVLRPNESDRSYGSVALGLVYLMANGRQAYLQWRESIGLDGLDRSTVNFGARFEF